MYLRRASVASDRPGNALSQAQRQRRVPKEGTRRCGEAWRAQSSVSCALPPNHRSAPTPRFARVTPTPSTPDEFADLGGVRRSPKAYKRYEADGCARPGRWRRACFCDTRAAASDYSERPCLGRATLTISDSIQPALRPGCRLVTSGPGADPGGPSAPEGAARACRSGAAPEIGRSCRTTRRCHGGVNAKFRQSREM